MYGLSMQEYCLGIRRNEMVMYATTCINPENTILSKESSLSHTFTHTHSQVQYYGKLVSWNEE